MFIKLNLIEQHFGLIGYALLLCFLVMAAVLIERILVLGWGALRGSFRRHSERMWSIHCAYPKALREELMSLWLARQQARLTSGVRLLNIVALIAPLLGLLGTVIGLIEVFEVLGQHKGPIEPALLANGLSIAMKTTAAGLIIALPALLGAHGLKLWADKIIASLEHDLNCRHLTLQGLSTEVLV
jgi:biopolymer transport protein ExbB